MSRLTIERVKINNRQKCLVIECAKGTYRLPYVRLDPKPSKAKRLVEAFVDEELGKSAVTYRLSSGEEGAVHLDAFLDYAREPEFMQNLVKYKLSVLAQELLDASGLSRGEVRRRLRTSASQLNRLLDQTNTTKSIDEMFRLLVVIGCEVHFHFDLPAWPAKHRTAFLKKGYDFHAKLAA